MTYTVFDSAISPLYENFIYTHDDWIAFDIAENQTIMLIGSYDSNDNTITGTTKQMIEIISDDNGTPTINITNLDNREDTINYAANTCYQIVSNIDHTPFARNANYETGFKTYNICFSLLVAFVFCFVFSFLRGLIPICRR